MPEPVFDLAWNKSVAELLREYELSQSAVNLEPEPSPAPIDGQPQADTEPEIDPLRVTVPRAFIPLGADSNEFAEQALRIRRSRDMRLMFHQSWLQPLRSRQQSLPIVVDGLIDNSDYPALQGSLLLYVSRYLHIETNLWLNTGKREAGTRLPEPVADGAAQDSAAQEVELTSAEWRMPDPPLPPEVYSWTPWAFRVELEAGFSDDIDLPAWGPEQLHVLTEIDPADILQPIQVNARRSDARRSDARRSDARRSGNVDVEQILEQPWYPFQHAVLVQQKRRMRGGELHYLDHPLLGIVLRVSPYEFEPFYQPQELSQELGSL